MTEQNDGYIKNLNGNVIVPREVRDQIDSEFMQKEFGLRSESNALAASENKEQADYSLSDRDELLKKLNQEGNIGGERALYLSEAEALVMTLSEALGNKEQEIESALLERYSVARISEGLNKLFDELKLPKASRLRDLVEEFRAIDEAAELVMTGRALQIFDVGSLMTKEAEQRAKTGNRDSREQVLNARKNAMRYGGMRLLPDTSGALKELRSTAGQWGNFSKVIDALDDALTLADYVAPSEFRVRPILMDGAPGVGKTAFAMHVARIMGLPFEKVPASALQNGFVLCGSSKAWANTTPGKIFNLLSESRYATGVLLMDEVDKLSTDDRYTVLASLLDLLEPESARCYKDESADIVFDASRLIILMTSNSLEFVNEALKSRCGIFRIDEPDAEQRLNVAKSVVAQMNDGVADGKEIELDEEATMALAKQNMDLRDLIDATRVAYTVAIRDRSGIARPVGRANNAEKFPFGFIPKA